MRWTVSANLRTAGDIVTAFGCRAACHWSAMCVDALPVRCKPANASNRTTRMIPNALTHRGAAGGVSCSGSMRLCAYGSRPAAAAGSAFEVVPLDEVRGDSMSGSVMHFRRYCSSRSTGSVPRHRLALQLSPLGTNIFPQAVSCAYALERNAVEHDVARDRGQDRHRTSA